MARARVVDVITGEILSVVQRPTQSQARLRALELKCTYKMLNHAAKLRVEEHVFKPNLGKREWIHR